MFRMLASCTLLLTLCAAPVARAAEVRTDRRCYADPSTRQDTVQLAGSGFAPGATAQTTLDGAALGTGLVDSTGVFAAPFAAPSLDRVAGPGVYERAFTVGAADGVNAATATFTVSKLRAAFAPTRGNPRTLRVRFTVHGFALSSAEPVDVYLHYVTPGGRLKRTVKLGRAVGDCGRLTTSLRRLFAFTPSRGSWRLQLDTQPSYRRGTAAAGFLYYTIAVRVR